MPALLGGLLLLSVCLYGAEPGAVQSQPGGAQTVYLEYSEVPHPVMNMTVPLDIQSRSFPQEPVFKGRQVIRGHLEFGKDTNQFVPFAWDVAEGKLYLDLNRNRDLTDDPAGVVRAHRGFSSQYQNFTNVDLTFPAATGTRAGLMDLNFTLFESRRLPHCYASLRSFWQAKVSLRGKEWQLGLIDEPYEKPAKREPVYWLLRPWPAREQPFRTRDGSPDTFQFDRRLFFQNAGYEITHAWEPAGGNPRVKIQFKEEQPRLGELKLAGQFIDRLLLSGDRYVVLLDAPGTTVKVPVGTYSEPQVQLKAGPASARRQLLYEYPQARKTVLISERQAAVLAEGGPLTNTVKISRRGKSLVFNYELIGAAGGSYRLLGRQIEPEFTVTQGDKKLASGKFEFG